MPKDIKQLEDLIPDENNANAGTERGMYMVETSLESYGAGRSILVDKDGRVIAGNKTLQAAIEKDFEVEVVKTDGSKLVVVQREDLDLETDDRARLLAYADNRASEVGLNWDIDQLRTDLNDGVDLGDLFRDDELTEMGLVSGDGGGGAPDDPGAEEDKAEELLELWQVKRGDVWQIGSHRLMCGDGTSEADVKVLLDGAVPVLMDTDPPYGVNYSPEWREDYDDRWKYRKGTVQNDDQIDWRSAFELFPGDIMYVWHAGKFAGIVADSIESVGFEIRYQIIWNKQNFVFGRGNYHWKHEPCWYAVRKGKPTNWQGDRTQGTVWDIKNLNPAGGDPDAEDYTDHSTQKPLECMKRPIVNNTAEGEGVYDPFCGSGTTLVACEQTGRVGYGMDIEPKYVAIILQRLSMMNLEPIRVVEGQ